MENFTPLSPMAGGVLIGNCVTLLLLFNGRIGSFSGIMNGVFLPKNDRIRRLIFLAVISFKLILKRPAPILGESFYISRKSSVDKSLIFGSAIFGIGWGMSGYCPGPAVTGLGLLPIESVIMVVAIYMGFIAYKCVYFAYKAKST